MESPDEKRANYWELGKRIDTAYQSFFSMLYYAAEELQTSSMESSPSLDFQDTSCGLLLGLSDEIWDQILRIEEPRSILQGLMYEYVYHYIESYRSFLLVSRKSYLGTKSKQSAIFQKYASEAITSLTYTIKDKAPIVPYEKKAITYFLGELEGRKLFPEVKILGMKNRDLRFFSPHLSWVQTLNIDTPCNGLIVPLVRFLRNNTTLLTLNLSIGEHWKEWIFIDNRDEDDLRYLFEDHRLKNLSIAGEFIKGQIWGEQMNKIPEILIYYKSREAYRWVNHSLADLAAFVGGARLLEGALLIDFGEE